jgi:hypothetical protein
MFRNLRTVLMSAIVAMVVAAGTAAAGTTHIVPNIFGAGGAPPDLDANCKRAVVNLGTGSSWAHGGRHFTVQAFNLVGNQVYCLIRRKAKSDLCIKQLGPVPTVVGRFDHGAGKPGDWSGVDDLRDYVAAFQACVTGVAQTPA